MTATTVPISTDCAACGMSLRDDLDARAGLDRSCRAQLNYRKISSLAEALWAETNTLIHAIAQNRLRGDELRTAIFRIYELGFTDMAKRIERRVGSATREGIVETPMLPVVPTADPPKAVTVESVPAVPTPPMPKHLDIPFTPTEDQERALAAVRRIMQIPRTAAVVVIVGFAGVGKSASLMFMAEEHGLPIVIAPTGRAAMRVRELTGLEASTIHMWLYRAVEDPKTGIIQFVRKTPEEIEEKIPKSRLVILDEASMVGPDVWRDVITVVQQHALKLVCIGDGFQLPPVQAPNAPPFSVLTPAFAEQLGAERVEMTTVLRQAQDSPVIRASMAIRKGEGVRALRELERIQPDNLWNVCTAVHQQGGVVICHKNVTRFQVNANMRLALGHRDEMPDVGEPLLCRKNAYSAGVMNGETFKFPGWEVEPLTHEGVYDRYKDVRESTRFGAIRIGQAVVTISVEELYGRLQSGPRAIEIAASKYAKIEHLCTTDNLSPHLHANWGYCYTCHSAQGGQWPYVLVMLEPSIRLNEDEGRRWLYTAVSRSSLMTAIFYGGA